MQQSQSKKTTPRVTNVWGPAPADASLPCVSCVSNSFFSGSWLSEIYMILSHCASWGQGGGEMQTKYIEKIQTWNNLVKYDKDAAQA